MLTTLLWLRIPHWHWGTTRLQRPQDWRELYRSMWWGEKRNINDTKSPKTQSLQIYSTCASFCLASLSGQVCCKQFHLQNYLAEMTWFPTTSSSKQSQVNPQLVWFCFTTCCFRGLYRCCHPVVLIVRCGSCHFHSFFKALKLCSLHEGVYLHFWWGRNLYLHVIWKFPWILGWVYSERIYVDSWFLCIAWGTCSAFFCKLLADRISIPHCPPPVVPAISTLKS